MRRLILFSLLVPSSVLLLWWIAYRSYAPERWALPDSSFSEEEFSVRAADAIELPGTLTVPGSATVPNAVIVLVPDEGLDRDWNSPGVAFRTGERLATVLAGHHGDVVLRYDQRGTGATRASDRSVMDLELRISDLALVLQHARARFPEQDPVVLAQGSGCILALAARAMHRIRLGGLVLTGCNERGSHLDQWGESLFTRMEERGVPTETIVQARQEWRTYRENGQIATDEALTAPDIVAFRNTVRHLQSADMRAFRETADRLNFSDLLNQALAAGTPVLHLVGALDREASPNDGETDKGDSYRYATVPEMGHFLKRRQTPGENLPQLVWERLNPFTELSPDFLEMLYDWLDRQEPQARFLILRDVPA
ncbi:MAG: alpha/beta hydrolase [Spirochaetales bacterium]|nr:alpha/beta hydrolase [Spirochaetales bacterium]